MSGGMWKPGSLKPDPNNPYGVFAANNKSPDDMTKADKQKKKKQRDKSLDSLGSTKSNKSSGSGKTQLSNITRNMRFMQRKQSSPGILSPSNNSRRASSEDNDDDNDDKDQSEKNKSMDIDDADNNSEGEDDDDDDNVTMNDCSNQKIKTPQHTVGDDDDCDAGYTVVRGGDDGSGVGGIVLYNPMLSSAHATPTDMYGPQGTILLGRRSFGGFNKHVAENWYLSSLSAATSAESSSSVGKKKRISDQTLLKRYEGYVADPNQMNGKRARRNSAPQSRMETNPQQKKPQSISNSAKKKRSLDDIMR